MLDLAVASDGNREVTYGGRTTPCQNITDMIRLIQQIAEDIRWLRQRAEERDRIKKQDDQKLLERIEQTHRGPQKP